MKTVNLLLRGILGGALYCLIELLWRSFTHISMFFVGGLCFLILAQLEKMQTSFPRKLLAGVPAVTAVEFLSGLLLNRVLRLNVWDYSARPFNLLGQICLLYAILWIPLCALGLLLNRGLDRLEAALPPARRPGRAPQS